MFFILNHLHIILAIVALLVLCSKIKLRIKITLLIIISFVFIYLKTSVLEYTNQPTARTVHQQYNSEEFIPNDLILKPNLTREERETKTKELIDFQDKFNEILKE